MVKRQLVTTALEATWPTDGQPILFLGEWCKLFDRRYVWENLDYTVAPYHWDDRNKLFQDYGYLQIVYEEVLRALALHLNKHHGVNHSLRYWRILVGPWLGYFIQIVFDRWFMLKTVLDTQEIAGIQLVQRQPGEGIPHDMEGFMSLFVEDDWNELIYGQILNFMCVSVTFVSVGTELTENNTSSQQEPKQRLNRSLKTIRYRSKKKLINFIASTTRFLPADYFLIGTYLGNYGEFRLQLKLGQVPRFWQRISIRHSDYSQAERGWKLPIAPLCHAESTEYGSEFTALLTSLIPQHIPITYLEGYRPLVEATHPDRLGWPSQPKLIFNVSSDWNSNEVFKAWTATQVERGTQLLIGQHGGNYGMARWGFTEDHQLAISDRFVTWGWSDPTQPKLLPVGNLKGFGRGTIQPDKAGKALLVEMTIPRYSYHMYSIPVAAGQWTEYFEDQCRFVRALPEQLHQDLIVRLYKKPELDYGHRQVDRWRSQFPNMELDLGTYPMQKRLRQIRLYISTYNATTYLESLSLNFPTLIFWNPSHWELRDGVQPYFNLLKEVGIFHETPESAAQQMTRVWDDIDAWWYDPKTQKTREIFCDFYAHMSANHLKILARSLRNIASNSDNPINSI
jgi:putative transferase (TIGR04331 family)